MPKQDYRDLTKEQLVELLRARDRKRFGLIWERDAIEHDKALNQDFVVFDHDPELSHGEGPYENLIIEGDNFDALRALRSAVSVRATRCEWGGRGEPDVVMRLPIPRRGLGRLCGRRPSSRGAARAGRPGPCCSPAGA